MRVELSVGQEHLAEEFGIYSVGRDTDVRSPFPFKGNYYWSKSLAPAGNHVMVPATEQKNAASPKVL